MEPKTMQEALTIASDHAKEWKAAADSLMANET